MKGDRYDHHGAPSSTPNTRAEGGEGVGEMESSALRCKYFTIIPLCRNSIISILCNLSAWANPQTGEFAHRFSLISKYISMMQMMNDGSGSTMCDFLQKFDKPLKKKGCLGGPKLSVWFLGLDFTHQNIKAL